MNKLIAGNDIEETNNAFAKLLIVRTVIRLITDP